MVMSCHEFDFENDVKNVCFGTMSMVFCTQSKFLNKARGFELDMFILHETKIACDGTCGYGGESINHNIGCLMRRFATQNVIHNILKSL